MVVPSFRTTPFNPQAILNPDFLALNNAPPVTRSYQISKGGTQPSPEVIFNAGNSNSVNLLKRWLYIRPGSILLALHDTDGGGGPGFAVLNAMIIELPYEGETAGIKELSAQIEVNKTEAANVSTFVAGWRPFIGWICGAGLACQFIAGPLFTWISNLMHRPTPFPTLDLGTLMTLLLGMLGLGGLRTYEKVAGVPGADQLK